MWLVLAGCEAQVTEPVTVPVAVDGDSQRPGSDVGWSCTLVGGGDTRDAFPIAAAVEVDEVEHRVFVVGDLFDKRSTIDDRALAFAYACSSGDGCAHPTLITGPDPIGAPLKGTHALLPAVAVERDGDLRVTLRQKVEQDCDGDGITAEQGDPDDQDAIDLQTFTWDPYDGVVRTTDLAVNDGACVDRGVNALRTDEDGARACWTEKAPDAHDRVVCADEDPGGDWSPAAGPTTDTRGDADHPSLALLGGRRFVALHQGLGALDAARVHAVDDGDPGSEPIAELATARAEEPGLAADADALRLVWQEGLGTDAAILTSSCGDGCADPADWTAPEVVADGSTGLAESAELPQVAIDGERQWVAWTADTDPGPGVAARVVAATRCGDDPWTLAEVQAPDVPTSDQSLEFGRPALAVDRSAHTAHLVFAEFDTFTARDDVESTTHRGLVRLCSRAYDPCR